MWIKQLLKALQPLGVTKLTSALSLTWQPTQNRQDGWNSRSTSRGYGQILQYLPVKLVLKIYQRVWSIAGVSLIETLLKKEQNVHGVCVCATRMKIFYFQLGYYIKPQNKTLVTVMLVITFNKILLLQHEKTIMNVFSVKKINTVTYKEFIFSHLSTIKWLDISGCQIQLLSNFVTTICFCLKTKLMPFQNVC